MNLIDQINDFFGKDAHIEIKGEYMHITIGNQTLVIKPPSVDGAQSMAPLPKP